MNIAFYTIDFYDGRQKLMPWRTVIEICQRMIFAGHHVIIINGSSEIGHDFTCSNISVKSIGLGYDKLANKVIEEKIDILFMQITWRDGLKDMSSLNIIKSPKIAYFSGGVYDSYSAFLLAKNWGVNVAKPYLLESLIPKRILIKKLKEVGFKTIIGQTPYTTHCCKKAGFENSIAFLTGKDKLNEINPDYSLLKKYGLEGNKWMLFSGAPAPTRGACELLKAIDRTYEKDVKVVFLMRTDIGSDYDIFNKTYECLKHKEKVVIIREKANREQLRVFFGNAYYVLLPFLVIPSEIPVTYLEVFSCGTPIITFNNGGTTQLLNHGMVISGKSISSLAVTIDKAWKSDEMRNQKSKAALDIIRKHPTWDEVASKWMQLIK